MFKSLLAVGNVHAAIILYNIQWLERSYDVNNHGTFGNSYVSEGQQQCWHISEQDGELMITTCKFKIIISKILIIKNGC